MYFSIKIESTTPPRVTKVVYCHSLEDVERYLYNFISFTKPFTWYDELDIDLSQIEIRDMEHNEYMRKQIIDNLMNPCCREIKFLDNCYALSSVPCRLSIKKVEHCGKEGEHMYIDDSINKQLYDEAIKHLNVKFSTNLDERTLKYCETDVKSVSDIYRNFRVIPERVIYNDPATIVFWKDGTKTVVKCMEGDTYNPEVGLAMCVCKKLYGSKYHKFFRYYAPKEPVAEKTEEKKEASLDEIYDKIAEMTKEVLKTDKSFLEKFASRLFGEEENLK